MLRIPHYLESWLPDGSEVVSLTHRLLFTDQKNFFTLWYSFLFEIEYTPGLIAAGSKLCVDLLRYLFGKLCVDLLRYLFGKLCVYLLRYLFGKLSVDLLRYLFGKYLFNIHELRYSFILDEVCCILPTYVLTCLRY
jgi:hypothetical protein